MINITETRERTSDGWTSRLTAKLGEAEAEIGFSAAALRSMPSADGTVPDVMKHYGRQLISSLRLDPMYSPDGDDLINDPEYGVDALPKFTDEEVANICKHLGIARS